MQNKTEKRIVSLLLMIALVIGALPFGNALAYAEGDRPMLTEAHSTCTHIHEQSCGYAEDMACAHACGQGCAEVCNHIRHDAVCGYMKAAPCGHKHDTDCADSTAGLFGGESAEKEKAALVETDEMQSAGEMVPLDVSDYDPAAIEVINRLIDNNDLKASKNDPESWPFATWDDSTPKKLTDVDMEFPKFYSLNGEANFSGVASLVSLSCPNNSLTKLNMSGCTSLVYLDCRRNDLTEINMSGCTSLADLMCSNNSLAELDLSDCIGLGSFTSYFLGDQIVSFRLLESTPGQYALSMPLNNPTFADPSISYADGILTSNGGAATTKFTTQTGQSGMILSGKMQLTYGPAPSPITADFTDPNFLAAVRYNIFKSTGEIYAHDVSGITSLNVSDRNITSLAGIEHFTALRTLICSDNDLTSVDLSGLSNLEYLNCYNNSLTALDVSGLFSLQTLDCKNNRLTALDLSRCNQLSDFDGNGQNVPLILQPGAPGEYTYAIALNAPTFTQPSISYDGALKSTSTTAASTDFTVETGLPGKRLSGTMHLRYADVAITADFTDPNFLAEVRSTANIPTGEIYASDVAGISRLIVDDKEIASLAGIQHFTSLTVLSCFNNQLTSLDVSGLSHLKELYCFGNQLTTLDVSGLDQLTDLGIAHNRLTSLDISGLDSLAYLDCLGNQLTTLDVSSLRNLGELYCKNNQLGVLNVAGLSKLIALNCAGNQLTALNVSGLSSLRNLNCSYNYMPGTSAVTGRSIPWDGASFVFEPQRIPPSYDITVTGGTSDKAAARVGETVTITADTAPAGQRFKEWNISPAVSFVDDTNLKSATAKFIMPNQAVTATAVYEAAPITADFTDPNFLAEVRSTISKPIGDIFASDVAGITVLNVENKNIESLAGIEHFTALSMLICDNNRLETLDVSSLINLNMLACSSNRLTLLNVSDLSKLTHLYCYDNELTSLDVSGLGSLVLLNCSGNKLTALHMSGLHALKDLRCHNNQLTALDVSGLDSLASLNCAYNRLATLNVSGLLSLQGLNCPYNQLTTLDVSGLSILSYLDCSYNYMPDTSAVTGQSISWDGSNYIFEPQRIHAVTVRNGTGSGYYAQGDTVTITADAASSGKIFDKWASGDGVVFANASSASTTFIMPGNNVTVTATYKNAGGEDPAPDHTFRTLIDRATGITVSGNINEEAALTVTDLDLGDNAADNAIHQRMNGHEYAFILGRNISLSGSFTGTLILSLPVGSQYNGQTVTILHAKQDGTLETYIVKVQGGKATFEVISLSPFAVFLKDGLDDIPKTGDNSSPWKWWLLWGVSAAGIIILVLVRKKLLGASHKQ